MFLNGPFRPQVTPGLARKVAGEPVLLDRSARRLDAARRRGAASCSPGVYAFSRLDRKHPHEYVVALNNSEQTASASIPTYMRDATFERVYGEGPDRLRSNGARRLQVSVGALSTVVYRAKEHIPRSRQAPFSHVISAC